MTRDDIRRWVEEYLRAWSSNDPQEIGRMFVEDAVYLTGPWDEPWTGRDEIVARWLERKDEPGTWTFDYDVLAADEDLGVIEGETAYRGPSDEVYRNLWLVRLDHEGRATWFSEWWVRRP